MEEMELMLFPLFFSWPDRRKRVDETSVTIASSKANNVRRHMRFILGRILIFRAGGPRSGEYCAN